MSGCILTSKFKGVLFMRLLICCSLGIHTPGGDGGVLWGRDRKAHRSLGTVEFLCCHQRDDRVGAHKIHQVASWCESCGDRHGGPTLCYPSHAEICHGWGARPNPPMAADSTEDTPRKPKSWSLKAAPPRDHRRTGEAKNRTNRIRQSIIDIIGMIGVLYGVMGYSMVFHLWPGTKTIKNQPPGGFQSSHPVSCSIQETTAVEAIGWCAKSFRSQRDEAMLLATKTNVAGCNMM